MGIPSKQIGWSNDSNLLWSISNQLLRLTKLLGSVYSGSLPKLNGAFNDVNTQSIPINTNGSMKIRTTTISNGVFIENEDTIKVLREADYNIQFSAQFKKNSGGTHFVFIWLEKNGVAVPDSSGKVTIAASGDYVIAAWNYFEHLTASDDIRLMWRQDDAIVMLHEEATVNYPAIPSLIVTVNQVN